MPEQREVYQNSQPPADGASSSPTVASTGSTGAVRATSANTSVAASRTPKKARSTRIADLGGSDALLTEDEYKARRKSPKRTAPTAEQALTVAQDIVRLCHDAGIVSFIVNTKSGDAAIVLGGVRYCETCRNLFIGAACQKCESQK